jgi:predicted Fe-Mo cluster-binding NifX family protein
MRVAIVTNNERTVAKHIGLCKKIAVYENGEKVEVVENPIMKMIKEKGITLNKEGQRHLGVSQILPEFLKDLNVDVLIATEFRSQVLEQNLQLSSILPYVTQERDIEKIIKNFNEEDIMRGFNRGFGQNLPLNRGRGFGQNKEFALQDRDFDHTAPQGLGRRAPLGRGLGAGLGRGAGFNKGLGAGQGRGRGRGFGAGQGRGFGNR